MSKSKPRTGITSIQIPTALHEWLTAEASRQMTKKPPSADTSAPKLAIFILTEAMNACKECDSTFDAGAQLHEN